MEIESKEAKVILDEIHTAVGAVLKKHKLEIGKRRGTYGESLTYSVTATPVRQNKAGVNLASIEAKSWGRFGESYGFVKPLEVLGKTFKFRGNNYKFTGMRPKASKYPVCGEDTSGKKLAFTIGVLKELEGFNLDKVSVLYRSEFK